VLQSAYNDVCHRILPPFGSLELKLADISTFLASSFLPPSLRSFVFKPSEGASGGIITAWNANALDLLSHSIDDYSITTTFAFRSDNLKFSIINVYGPCTHSFKPVFLSFVEHVYSTLSLPTAILGGIRHPKDKSNDNFNASEARFFNDFINNLGLLEIPLLDRQFTWSNQQDTPILARLDWIFVSNDWSLALPDSTHTSATRPTSDHVPLILEASSKALHSTIFRFENSWLNHSDFPFIVSSNWNSVGPSHDHLSHVGRLCLKLKRFRSVARSWSRACKLPSVYLLNCHTVISWIDRLEECRSLSTLEARDPWLKFLLVR
jgi:hypothetical protein